MNVPLDEVIYFDAITTTPSTGAAVDADSTPTFAVYEEATDTDIGVGGNLTKRTSLTGNYRGSFTLSAANGFEVGKWYSIIGSAVVGGVTGKAVLKNFRVVAAEAIAGKPKADVDALLGTAWLTPGTAGTPDVNVKLISGDATAADNAEAFFDGTGYAGAGNTIPTVTTLTNLPAIAANWLTAAGLAADAVTEIQSGLATSSALATLQTSVDDLPTNAELAASQASADDATLAAIAALSIPTVAAIADAVWDEATVGHTTSGTFGEQVKTDIDAMLADTNELQTDWADGGRLDVILDARASQTSVDDIPTVAEFEARTLAAASYSTASALAALVTTVGVAGSGLTAADDAVIAAIAALNNLSAAAVNAEVVDALATDTYAEPGQGAPGATISLAAKVNYLYKFMRNKKTQTSTENKVYADDGTTVDHKSTTSDDGTTTTFGEQGTGP